MLLIDQTVSEFVEELASNSPAPGGGSTAALAGALGAALSLMVCNFTVDKPKFSEVQEEISLVKEKGLNLKDRLMKDIDGDTNAFAEVMKAYKLPKETDAEKTFRAESIQEANKQATLLPINVAQACIEVMELSAKVVLIGNPNTACDGAVSGVMAYAGFQGAILNAKINLHAIKDEAFNQDIRYKIMILQDDADRIHQVIQVQAKKVIG